MVRRSAVVEAVAAGNCKKGKRINVVNSVDLSLLNLRRLQYVELFLAHKAILVELRYSTSHGIEVV